jgi:hypothetical protein
VECEPRLVSIPVTFYLNGKISETKNKRLEFKDSRIFILNDKYEIETEIKDTDYISSKCSQFNFYFEKSDFWFTKQEERNCKNCGFKKDCKANYKLKGEDESVNVLLNTSKVENWRYAYINNGKGWYLREVSEIVDLKSFICESKPEKTIVDLVKKNDYDGFEVYRNIREPKNYMWIKKHNSPKFAWVETWRLKEELNRSHPTVCDIEHFF